MSAKWEFIAYTADPRGTYVAEIVEDGRLDGYVNVYEDQRVSFSSKPLTRTQFEVMAAWVKTCHAEQDENRETGETDEQQSKRHARLFEEPPKYSVTGEGTQ